MKKIIKIALSLTLVIILCIIIDIISIFTISKPIFAIKARTPYTYIGIFYNTYNCPENSIAQIKPKYVKYNCTIGITDKGKVISIEDQTKNIKDFACAEALESFYEDEKYIYYYNCIKGDYMKVKYDSGYEETIKEALKYKTIKISDLDKYKINYIKHEK